MARRPEFYYDAKTGYYRKRIKLPDGRWKDIRARSKEELRKKLYDRQTAIRQGLALDDETTVAEFAREWYANRKDGLSLARQSDFRTAINLRICPVIGAMKLRDVRPEHCQRVMARASGLSYSAQQKAAGTLKQLFASAVDNGLILRSPAEKIKAGGKKPEEKKALTREQCAQLEEAVKGTRAYVFVMLGLYAGLRREEICGLRWRDVDLEADPPRLTVHHATRFTGGKAAFPSPLKTKAAHRTIPIPDNLKQALQEEKRKTDSAFVIRGRDGQPISYQGMRNLIRIIDRRAPVTEGVRKRRERIERERGKPFAKRATQKHMKQIDFRPTPHQLRHTYITRLIEAGLDVKRVQYLAGHSDIRMTLGVYAHVTQNRPEDLIARINETFAPPEDEQF